MKAFFNYLYWLFFARPAKQKLRTGALHSLRLYVNAVSGARKVSMYGVFGIMGLSSITIGFFMLIGGLLWFANLNPIAYPWIMVVTGALLTLAGIIGYLYAFRQKLWVEMSQINEFTNKALATLPVTERPENPAVNGLWTLATEMRLREMNRIEEHGRLKLRNDAANLLNTEVPDVEHLAPQKNTRANIRARSEALLNSEVPAVEHLAPAH